MTTYNFKIKIWLAGAGRFRPSSVEPLSRQYSLEEIENSVQEFYNFNKHYNREQTFLVISKDQVQAYVMPKAVTRQKQQSLVIPIDIAERVAAIKPRLSACFAEALVAAFLPDDNGPEAA